MAGTRKIRAHFALALAVFVLGYIGTHDALIAETPHFSASSTPIVFNMFTDHDCPLEHGGVIAQVPYALHNQTILLVRQNEQLQASLISIVHLEQTCLRGPPARS